MQCLINTGLIFILDFVLDLSVYVGSTQDAVDVPTVLKYVYHLSFVFCLPRKRSSAIIKLMLQYHMCENDDEDNENHSGEREPQEKQCDLTATGTRNDM